MKKFLIWVGVPILYLLHQDFWFWNDTRLVLGLPVGLLYHAFYCVAASLMMIALVTFAWPKELEAADHLEEKRTSWH